LTYRIHRSVTQDTVVFTLSGDLDIEHAARLKEFLANEANGRVTLDLKDVTLVGPIAVRFLAGAETAGVRIVNCPDRRGESFPAANDAAARRAGAAKMSLPLEYPERLGEKVRAGVVELLNQQLADALDLALQAKQAHWNVKGPSFIALHELFDSVVEEIVEHADDLAERAVELGGTAFGSVRTAANTSRLPGYPLDISSGRQHVAALSAALAKFGASARAGIDAATALGDVGTISTT
jgi:starvation-inducible DNA-binding protein